MNENQETDSVPSPSWLARYHWVELELQNEEHSLQAFSLKEDKADLRYVNEKPRSAFS